jgi:hypothetical protein
VRQASPNLTSWYACACLAGTRIYRSMLRAASQLFSEIGMETFEQRLRDEQQRSQAVAATLMLLSAWATTGPK